MKSIMLVYALICSISGATLGQSNQKESSTYLHQEPPGLIPEVFAPGIVSLENEYEYGSVFSSNGREFYYAVVVDKKPEIRFIKFENNEWTAPVKLIFSDKYGYNDPFLSPDERKLFFISDRALDGQGDKKDIDIWYVERKENGWSDPINAGEKINSDKNEYYVSFTNHGAMYFSSNTGTDEASSKNFDIYYSEFSNDEFQSPKKLSNLINTQHYEADVFISLDEQYIIYCAERPDGHGRGDLYISFKDDKGEWQKAKNMGSSINTSGYEFCPFVSGDGRFLFLSRDGDIYWMNSDIINTLK